MSRHSHESEYQALITSWERRAPIHRRFGARLGLQGKLVLCFMALLAAALGGSCLLFTSRSSQHLADAQGEHARQISYALSLAARHALADNESEELQQIGQDLLKSRNILFVAFLDDQAHCLVLNSRDPDFVYDQLSGAHPNPQELMKVRRAAGGVLGERLEIVAPILGRPALSPTNDHAAGVRLLGYVAVGLSLNREQEQDRQITYYVIAIGAVIALVSLPLAYLLVRRIFQPIRQLVDATLKIADGEMDTQVAIHRPDVIGTLARSFNDMVLRIRNQQQALKEANDQLEQSNHDLEDKVLQRTVQLAAANKRLSSEIAEKEDFLRAVSHDLNAPLRNISGMASMLLLKHKEQFDQDIVHRLQRIQKNVEVETDLITELLELSRIKTRRQKIEPIETQALVCELAGMFEDDLKRHNIALTLDSPLPVLNAEPARLRQVFQNLIDNAIKYMGDSATREIHIGCALKPSEAEFYVRDTGMGIEPEDLGRIFYVFRRGRNGLTRNVDGKGVGLASVKSIIENYQGSIWVESQVGHGSTFHFTINGVHVAGASAATRRPLTTAAGPMS